MLGATSGSWCGTCSSQRADLDLLDLQTSLGFAMVGAVVESIWARRAGSAT